ncbi:MAG: cytoplasmic protein [Leptothrix sp. (in: Bacteria)]|nr:cytoplasmic protein [Leptothrix sp. (in: b-proteobacteria)]
MADLLAAYRHTTDNRAEIESSRSCGCCSCVQIFPPDDIVAWSGLDASSFDDPDAASLSGGTALCPHCGREAVIGDNSGYRIDAAFLTTMNEAWFQRTIIRKPQPKR